MSKMGWDKAQEGMRNGWRVKRLDGPELQMSMGRIMSRQPNGSWDEYKPTSADTASTAWVVIGEKEY